MGSQKLAASNYFLKTCKKPFNHLELHFGAGLTNFVSKFCVQDLMGGSEITRPCCGSSINTFSALASVVFPLALKSWIASLRIVCS